MLCAREHIHWLYGLYSISVLRKIFKIPRGGGRIAAHHHDALGGHGQYGLQRRLVAALAGRVQNDDIGQQAVGGQFLCGGSGVGTEKLRVLYPIAAALRRALSTASGTISTPISLPQCSAMERPMVPAPQ